MNDQEYLQHCQKCFRAFADDFAQRTAELAEGDSLKELAAGFTGIARGEQDIYTAGTELVVRLFTTYPDFAPLFPRELLWFLGGECLHFMPDEEIELNQRLDSLRSDAAQQGKIINFEQARAKLLKTK